MDLETSPCLLLWSRLASKLFLVQGLTCHALLANPESIRPWLHASSVPGKPPLQLYFLHSPVARGYPLLQWVKLSCGDSWGTATRISREMILEYHRYYVLGFRHARAYLCC